jgi:serine phosphatase RsbU (regulator of sigma subunit)
MVSRVRRLSALVAVAVLVVSIGLSWLAYTVNARAESDLLDRQIDQAAQVLGNGVNVISVQLADAGQVVTATGAEPRPFQRFAAARLTSTQSFVSLSLIRMGDDGGEPVATEGEDPVYPAGGLDGDFFQRLEPTGQLSVAGILPGDPPRLGYALMLQGDSGLIVYAEQALPPGRRVSNPENAAFGGIDFAVYLGTTTDAEHLLLATAPIPIEGDTESSVIPFGDTSITVVGAAQTELSGSLSGALPWIVLGVGAVLAAMSGLVVETLSRRRTVAEELAADNERLYHQQRGIAGTLQHALLPALPRLDGVEVAARDISGVDELDVGGDWYDVIPRGPGCCVFVVGDISGRGLPAATTMAALRFAVRAYLAQGDDIADALAKLHGLLRIDTDHQFATVVIGELDVTAGRLRLVCAGHFPPVLVAEGRAEQVECPVAPPIGVDGLGAPPAAVTIDVPANATLLAFTDGLVERRREVIDIGLQRLTAAAAATHGAPLEQQLDDVMHRLADDGGRDDTVLVGLRWTGSR